MRSLMALSLIFAIAVMSSFFLRAEICSECGSFIGDGEHFIPVDETEFKFRKPYQAVFQGEFGG